MSDGGAASSSIFDSAIEPGNAFGPVTIKII
jgi:hypothetical protein